MKRYIALLVVLLLFVCIVPTSFASNLTTLKISEVTHSVFYAPQYVAISLGFFEKHDINP